MSDDEILTSDENYWRGADGVVEPYLFEPEYSDKELRQIELQMAAAALAIEAAAVAGPQPQPSSGSSRTDWWCNCGNCAPMLRMRNVCAADHLNM